MYLHFRTIAESTDLPIILYAVPSRTNVSIDIETVEKLAHIKNIVGIKDASGDLDYTAGLVKSLPKDFGIYSGNDNLTLPMLALGIDGSISVFANIMPRENHDIYEAFENGNFEKARDLHLKFFDLIKALFTEVKSVPVKAAVSLMGLCQNELRLPLTKANESTIEILKEKLKDFGLC